MKLSVHISLVLVALVGYTQAGWQDWYNDLEGHGGITNM